MAVSRLRSCERSFWHDTTMLVGRCVMRTAESAVLTPCPPGPDERKTSIRSSSSRTLTSTSSTSGVTATDAKLVWRRRVELAAQACDAVRDLGVEGSIVRLGRELQQHVEILCLAGQLREARHRAREIGTLADQFLGATIVLPEARRAHLHVQRGEPLLFGRDVKDAPEARRYAARGRPLRASPHSASSARAPKAA